MSPPALRRDGEETTDHDLVAQVRAGDDRAFEQLYRRYHRRIASYIQGMVHDHARAEDITQDVFMSALRRMRETDRPIAFKPWVYEIAKNACIDQFRRSRRAEEVSMDADDGLGSADYGRLVSAGPTPDVAVDHKQQLDHLCGAFGGLSETHHEILVMRELEGLSYREIGDKLGMTRPAVESTLFRARRRLTEEYDQLVTGERCVRVQGIITAADGAALGARDRRRVARHVSYCQPCMRHARLAGLDSTDLVHKPVRAKIAALLPLPAFLKARWSSDSRDDSGGAFAQWSLQASTIDPGVVSGWGKAAAAAVTIALAGVGAGVATNPPDSLSAVVGGGLIGEDADRARSSDSGGAALTGATGDTRSGGSAGSVAGDRAGSGARTSTRKSGDGGETTTRTGDSDGGSAGGGSGSQTSSGSGSSSGSGTSDTLSDTSRTLGDALPKLGGGDGSSSDSGGSGTGLSIPSAPSLPGVDPNTTSGGDAVGDTAGTAGDTAGTVGDTVDSVTESGSSAGSTVGDTVESTTGTVGDAVEDTTDTVSGIVGG